MFPTKSQYQDAILHPRLCLTDPVLRMGKVDAGRLGLPTPWAGGFGVVFRFRAMGKQWALKCWTADIGDAARTYREVDAHLRLASCPHFVPFKFDPSGIRLGGESYPLLAMEWVDAPQLKTFIASHLHNPARLEALAAQWRQLALRLRHAQIDHGDLQHGNINVVSVGTEPEIRLVDYDTMVVPGLRNVPDLNAGLPSFQHPARGSLGRKVSGVDNFAHVVIYTSILAVARAPALWRKYDVADAERLLFDREDFLELRVSRTLPLLRDLQHLGAELVPLCDWLRRSCQSSDPLSMPHLEEILRVGSIPAPASSLSSPPSAPPASAGQAEPWWTRASAHQLNGSLPPVVVRRSRPASSARWLLRFARAVGRGAGWFGRRVMLPLARAAWRYARRHPARTAKVLGTLGSIVAAAYLVAWFQALPPSPPPPPPEQIARVEGGVGAKCEEASECSVGLACVAGRCAVLPPAPICSGCSHPGTVCEHARCRLMPGKPWSARPWAISVSSGTTEGLSVCMRPTGSKAWACSSTCGVGVVSGTITRCYLSANQPTIALTREQIEGQGIDMKITEDGLTIAERSGAAHAHLFATELVFRGGIAHDIHQGRVEKVVIRIE